MSNPNGPVKVLYSFPHKLGAERICYTAWQQVNGLAAAGADLTVFAGALHRPVPANVKSKSTLARGRLRIPYKALGSRRAFALHDFITARRLEALRNEIDIIHAWPQGALRTMAKARELGIPVVLERPNAHTRFAYEAVREECDRIGVALPSDHEHAFNEDVLRVEEAEFHAADRLLCPSDFVVKTFIDRGFAPEQLARHLYGFDEKTYFPGDEHRDDRDGLKVLFVGVCAVRKGLHFALDAWLGSSAHQSGTLSIAGEFLPAYERKLKDQLHHPSVRALGHRTDVAELMRSSDILVLPSIEEGFGLVCTEAMGSGCVPLVSDACTELCRHMENALVHAVGDVPSLTSHFSLLHENRGILRTLRANGLRLAPEVTWTAAGKDLLRTYRKIVDECREARTAGRVPALRVPVRTLALP